MKRTITLEVEFDGGYFRPTVGDIQSAVEDVRHVTGVKVKRIGKLKSTPKKRSKS